MPGEGSTLLTDEKLLELSEIEAELRAFEERERRRLGLEAGTRQWHDPRPQAFTKDERAHTTILLGGLTMLHDRLIEAALPTLGYRVQALDCPDTDALQLGKEFGNRGQCNPTYFTVGNLLKHLIHLRDVQGLSTEEITKKYIFATGSGCGPCRFGLYATEYRKALRDAGFPGFRVLLFQQQGGLKQSVEEAGLALTPRFFITLLKCVFAGDVINVMGYRLRPYEVIPGATDRALEECRKIVSEALANRRSVWFALRRCRRVLSRLEVDRLRVKPKVAIIGEFWAMTTEGDGNYRLQRFLEAEGAECEVQPVTAWLLYNIWEVQYDIRVRMPLRRRDVLAGKNEKDTSARTLMWLRLARLAVERCFYAFASAIGFRGYKLPDMEEVARISHGFYHNQLRGGEGHMEVGKLIQYVTGKKAHLVVSVKPFGCMPSSGVSDGVQSLVTARYPEANFLAIETSGDGAVNVYSRVQMALFKARAGAQAEYERALAETGLTAEAARREYPRRPRLCHPLRYPRHRTAGTAANAVHELAGRA
jgi:predicted nucleotide-binding protein (sugar kinase/HSP70/actin superfamily)